MRDSVSPGASSSASSPRSGPSFPPSARCACLGADAPSRTPAAHRRRSPPRTALHDAREGSSPDGGHDPRPHLPRPSRVARTQQGAGVPARHRGGGPPRVGARLRERHHGGSGCSSCATRRDGSSSFPTESTTPNSVPTNRHRVPTTRSSNGSGSARHTSCSSGPWNRARRCRIWWPPSTGSPTPTPEVSLVLVGGSGWGLADIETVDRVGPPRDADGTDRATSPTAPFRRSCGGRPSPPIRPSRRDSGFPALEALACGTPARDHGGHGHGRGQRRRRRSRRRGIGDRPRRGARGPALRWSRRRRPATSRYRTGGVLHLGAVGRHAYGRVPVGSPVRTTVADRAPSAATDKVRRVRALVTGANGFVGSWLTAYLREQGDEVRGIDREVDITDGAAVRDAFIAAAPDAVYHLAAKANVGDSWVDPEDVLQVNAVGTLHVLEAARACPAPPRVLLTSSAEVYGSVAEDQLPVTEATPLAPVTPYAASKVAAEYLGVQAQLAHGLPVIRVRPFNHVGPGQSPGFVVAALGGPHRRRGTGGSGHHRRGQPRRPTRSHRCPRHRPGLPVADAVGDPPETSTTCARVATWPSPTSPTGCWIWRASRCSSSPTASSCDRSTSPWSAAIRRSSTTPPVGTRVRPRHDPARRSRAVARAGGLRTSNPPPGEGGGFGDSGTRSGGADPRVRDRVAGGGCSGGDVVEKCPQLLAGFAGLLMCLLDQIAGLRR